MLDAINIFCEPSVSSISIATASNFTSVSPASAAFGTPTNFTASGSGFLLLGINRVAFVIGATYNIYSPDILTDNFIDLNGGGGQVMFNPGTYSIQYSTDFGGTWTDTGLTVVIA
jgi:hypothetical protein